MMRREKMNKKSKEIKLDKYIKKTKDKKLYECEGCDIYLYDPEICKDCEYNLQIGGA
jgi:hypothetical protein